MDSITDPVDMYLSKLQKIVKDREVWCAAVHGVAESDATWNLNNKSNTMSEMKSLLWAEQQFRHCRRKGY